MRLSAGQIAARSIQLLADAALLLLVLLDDNFDILISIETFPRGIDAFFYR
jgi:hypothetical protein